MVLNDNLPQHPKILRAGAKLGRLGTAQALSLYVAAIAYARKHLTDGFIPDEFVRSCGLVQEPQAVTKVFCSPAVRLFHRTEGGFKIHDYFAQPANKRAAEVREDREKDRVRMASWRKKKRNGG